MPIIDSSFVLVGTTFPLDHGYCLFSAICRVVPGLHGDRRVGVHPIRGLWTGPDILEWTEPPRLSCVNRQSDAISQGGPQPRQVDTEEESPSPFLRQMLFQSAPPKLARPSSGESRLYPIAQWISPSHTCGMRQDRQYMAKERGPGKI
jgi:hypothetical protein